MRLYRGIRVRWAGWESDSYSLQQEGWQIAAEQGLIETKYDSLIGRVALKHPNFNMYALSQNFEFSRSSLLMDGRYTRFEHDVAGSFEEQLMKRIPYINICYMASRMVVNISEDISRLQPVDARPVYDGAYRMLGEGTDIIRCERKDINDLMIFKPIAKDKEFIIQQAAVPELLDIILDKQKDVQKKIREKRRKDFRKLSRRIEEMRLDNPSLIIENEIDNRNEIAAQIITV